jgi:hypothetical protein
MSEFTEEYELTSDLMGNRPTNGREGGLLPALFAPGNPPVPGPCLYPYPLRGSRAFLSTETLYSLVTGND